MRSSKGLTSNRDDSTMAKSNLYVFDFQAQEVRVHFSKDSEPWWVVEDVCNALELGDVGEALRKVPDDCKRVFSTETTDGKQDMLLVSEPGLYELIFAVGKPIHKDFRRWIFEIVEKGLGA